MNNHSNLIKERDAWYDNAKGFLMITVVIGHMIASVVNSYETFAFLSNFIYLFHMPAFAFISGYFMKRRVHERDYASVINKTVIPYLAAQILVYLFAVILPDGVKALSAERLYNSGVFSFLFPIYHLWYFFGVIVAFVFCIAVNAEKHPVRAFVISLAISLLSGYVPTVEFLKLTKVLAFLPFFVLGCIMPKAKIELLKNKKVLMIPGAIIIILSALCLWSLRSEGTLTGIFAMTSRYNNFVFDLSSVQAVAVRLGFIFVAILMTFSILAVCPKVKTPLTLLGKNSVYIYILHVFPLAIIRHYNYETRFLLDLDTPLLKIAYLALGVVICYVLVSKPIVKIFKPLFEPSFDIRKIGEYLKSEK